MSKRTSFIVTKAVATPYVINTNQAHNPRVIKYKKFKPGDMVTGTIQLNKAGKPDFILVAKTLVIPISAVKELVTQEVVTSNADGKDSDKKIKEFVKSGNPKTKYIDAGIVGAFIGFGLVWIAEKKQWISVPDKKNKLIGAALGSAAFMYLVYRIRNTKKNP